MGSIKEKCFWVKTPLKTIAFATDRPDEAKKQNERHSKEAAKANNEIVANHSAMSLPESAKWVSAHKGTPGKK